MGNSCKDGVALLAARDISISPDGKNAYVASLLSFAVANFNRDPASGALEQLGGSTGCISDDGLGSMACERASKIGPFDITVSPDGRNVYAVSAGFRAVTTLQRDPESGALKQLDGVAGCNAQMSTGCETGEALDGARDIVVSSDGATVYVSSSSSDAISYFDRDSTTGALIQKPGAAGCISQDSATSCQQGGALLEARGVAASPNGRNVYVVGSAVATFDRVVLGPPNSGGSAGQGGNGASQGDRRGHGERDRDGRVLKITGFRVSPRRVQPAPRGRSSFRFTLSEPARVKVTIESVRPGRKVGKRCKAQAPKLVKRPRCKRFIPAGRLSFQGRNAGANKIRFKARVRKRTLKPGAYRATIVATDRAGNSSAPKRAAFRVLAKKRRN